MTDTTVTFDLIRDLSELTRHDLPLAGGKAAALGDMMRAGIPVPSGFVLLSPAFDDLAAQAGLSAALASYSKAIVSQDTAAATALSAEIHDALLGADLPSQLSTAIVSHMRALGAPLVAVRSSAVSEDGARATWAGQMDSFLNTDEQTLLENVRKCWASLFGTRANFYRLHMDAQGPSTAAAVIVQQMVPSEVSGVAFSTHPITGDESIVLIEAGFGLGEAVVSGRITPDSYTVVKQTQEIVAKDVAYQDCLMQRAPAGGNEWRDLDRGRGEMQKLDDSLIRELADLVIAVEQHWGHTVDVEWALCKGQFYVVQSRAITGME